MSAISTSKAYAVLTRLAGDAWEDRWHLDDAPARFASWSEAERAIREHLDDCADAGLDYVRADFRIEAVHASP